MWSLRSNAAAAAAAALRPVGASWPVLAGSGASGPGHGSLLARGAPGWPSQAPDRAGGRQGQLGHSVPRQLLFLLIWSSVWGSAGPQPPSLCLGGKEASQSPHHPSLSSLTPAPVVMPPRRVCCTGRHLVWPSLMGKLRLRGAESRGTAAQVPSGRQPPSLAPSALQAGL